MPFGLTERERVQAYLDKIRESNPRFKGVDDSILGALAPKLYGEKADAIIAAGNTGSGEYDTISKFRKIIPKPEYDTKKWEDLTDKGSGIWTTLKGAMEGIDPLGVYRPLYSHDDSNSKLRMAGALAGGLGTAMIPVAGWAAKGMQAARLLKGIKGAEGAATLVNVLRGAEHGLNAVQAASAYESDRKQLGLDFDAAKYLGAFGAGLGGSVLGAKGAGKVGAKAMAMRGLPAIATSQAQMATNPYLERDMGDVPAPLRGVATAYKGITEAPDVMSAIGNTLTTAGIPLGFAALAARNKAPRADVKIPKDDGTFWDTSGTAGLEDLQRPAAVAAAQGAATAAPRTAPTYDFTPRSSFTWDDPTAQGAVKQSTLHNVLRAIDDARESSLGLKANLIDANGNEMMMVKHAGSDYVLVANPGEQPKMMGVDTVRDMEKSVLLPFTKEGIPTPIPRGFMPGASEGQMQARGFERLDPEGNKRIHYVIANASDSPDDPTIIVFEPVSKTFTVGPKSDFPEAANIWQPPAGKSPEELERLGKQRELNRRAGPFDTKIRGVGDVRASVNKRLAALGLGEL